MESSLDRNDSVTLLTYIYSRMPANHQHLRAFHAIAAEGGVSRAARRLNVSQPTLSQQLKALEARHGVVLFESRKAPLRLTLAGRDLFALTRRLFAIAADIDNMLGDTTEGVSGTLRLGSDNPYRAARLVKLMRTHHPQIDVHVRMGNARDVVQWLIDAKIDAALASDPPGEVAFAYEPLATDTLTCALPAGHPLVAFEVVPTAALGEETLLMRERTSKTRAFTERALADAGVEPRATIELQSRETIREGIALGLGVGVFFSTECPPDHRIAYRPLETPAGDYQLRSFLVYPSQLRRSGKLRALRAAVGDLLGEN